MDIVKLLQIESRVFNLLRRISLHPKLITALLIHKQFQYIWLRAFKIAPEFTGSEALEIP